MTVGRYKIVLWMKEREFSEMIDLLKAMAAKYHWTYFHGARETCPTTGTLHVDGYYEVENARKMKTEIKKFAKFFGVGFGDWQIARGNAGENQDYSQKEEDEFYSQGEIAPAGQGNRTDIADIAKAIMDGESTPDDICKTDPAKYHQYGRTFHKLEDLALREKFRTEMTEGEWVYGATGVGKSHYAFQGYNPKTHYLWKLNDNGWQDGYNGQETVIINEFRGQIKFSELLNLVDKWPYTIPRRGREPAPFLAKKVIITSSVRPEILYKEYLESDDSFDQFNRRFKVTKLEKTASPENEVTV